MLLETRFNSGKLVRSARKKMGLSQIEVATLADVSRRTVQHIESANPSVKLASIQAVGDVLHLDLESEDVAKPDEMVSNSASFGYWPFRMFKFVSAQITASELAFCYDENEFLSILEVLWKNFQQGILSISPNKARRVIELEPKFCSKAGYFSRYLGLWRANPRTFAFSSCNGERTGVSIVLPVSKSTYAEFVAGQRSNLDIQGCEILPQSSKIIYESSAPFFDSHERSHAINESLAFVSLNQLAHLLPYVRSERCDVASFSAHKENTKKMRSVGFEPVGSRVPKLEFPIWAASNRVDFTRDQDSETRFSTVLHYLSLRKKRLPIKAKLCFNAIGALQANQILAKQRQQGTSAA